MGSSEGRPGVAIKRAYAAPAPTDGRRVLVDRVWPRGMTAEALRLDERLPELAPSTALRRWFGHDPARWDEFRRRYRAELETPEARAALDELARRARDGRVTLVYSARDEEHNQARVLAEEVEERLRGGGDRGGGGSVTGEADHPAAPGPARDQGGDPGAPAGDDGELVAALERLVRAGVGVTARALAEPPAVDVTLQQWRVLVLLVDARGLRIGAIAARIGQSVPSASRLVGRLEERRLVRTDRDPVDGRATLVSVSPRGRRIVGAVVDRRRQLIKAAIAPRADLRAQIAVPALDALARALDHLA